MTSMASERPAPAAKLREMSLGDFEGLARVWANAGFHQMDRSDFIHMFGANPIRARLPRAASAPIGWVLEAEGRIVGTFGNLLSEYEFGGRRLLAASTHAVAVDTAFRSRSLGLISRFFGQDVDLLLATTANAAVSPLYRGLKASWVPHPCYDSVWFWITAHRGFSRAAIAKRGPGWRPIRRLAALPAAALWISDCLRTAARRTSNRTRVVDSFDERFDGLWDRLRTPSARLVAVRDRQTLEWHFAPARRRGDLRVVVLEDCGHLLGYAAMIRRDAPEIGLTRYCLADLQIREGDAGACRELIHQCLELARQEGIHCVEWFGFREDKRRAAAELGPRTRVAPCNPFLFKAKQLALAEALAAESCWDPCPYDGDAAF